MTSNRKVILYIAMSLDGYIAKPNDDLTFLSIAEREGEDYGYADFMKTIDTVILGRKTFDWVMNQVTAFPYADLETYVITSTAKISKGKTIFYSGNIIDLVVKLKRQDGENIFLVGGSDVIYELQKEKLIDEFYISIIPILLGMGVRLFKEGLPEHELVLVNSKQFPAGLVQLHYIST